MINPHSNPSNPLRNATRSSPYFILLVPLVLALAGGCASYQATPNVILAASQSFFREKYDGVVQLYPDGHPTPEDEFIGVVSVTLARRHWWRPRPTTAQATEILAEKAGMIGANAVYRILYREAGSGSRNLLPGARIDTWTMRGGLYAEGIAARTPPPATP